MGFFNALLNRTKPLPPKLDPLLVLPTAADTLDAAFGFSPTGLASVCFRAVEERAFRETEYDVRDRLNREAENASSAEIIDDSYGFTWMTIRRSWEQFHSLVEELHETSSTFNRKGFGAQLLCAVTEFHDRGGRDIFLVYLYKSGTFYPFAPRPGETRDNSLELYFRDALKGALPLEADLARWFPIWNIPGL
jgi:hypothetical protein